jgi:hypothetical protein
VGVRKKEARLNGRHPFRHIMLALFETPAGFALFKVLNEGKLDNAEELWKEFETPEVARKVSHLYFVKCNLNCALLCTIWFVCVYDIQKQ